jgi:hypothetical protein
LYPADELTLRQLMRYRFDQLVLAIDRGVEAPELAYALDATLRKF